MRISLPCRAELVLAISSAVLFVAEANPECVADDAAPQQVAVAVADASPAAVPVDAGRPRPTAPENAEPGRIDAQRAAAIIDDYLVRRMELEGVTPAPLAEDTEFLRRVYLDLGGRVPSTSEVRAFLADNDPGKRHRIVEELLSGPLYPNHATNLWQSVLIPGSEVDNNQRFYQVPGFREWLHGELRANTPYDKLVREVLTTPLGNAQQQYQIPSTFTPLAFYQLRDIAPENLAAGTSRVFLGTRLECAQCHDHPFDTWKQEQFWEFAAFYAGIERNSSGSLFERFGSLLRKRPVLKIPDTNITVSAKYLDGTELDEENQPLRVALAEWLTSPENDQFARTVTNRIWAQMFGRGIVEPIDDFSEANPATHPELLDELARMFVENGYDLKFLYRAIAATEAYQRTSRLTHPSQDDTDYFARMNLKGLSVEQLDASIKQAVGLTPEQTMQARFNNDNDSASLLAQFQDLNSSPLEREATILQALAMMNSSEIGRATDLRRSPLLQSVTEFPLMTDAERIETLFLAVVGRKPTPSEQVRYTAYVRRGGVRKDSKQALTDVMWVLLNSSEFVLNR